MRIGYFFAIASFCISVSISLLSMENQSSKCIVQLMNDEEVELDGKLIPCIPTIHDCCADVNAVGEIKIPLKIKNRAEWQLLSDYLPLYKEWWDLDKSGADSVNEETAIIEHTYNGLSFTHKKTGFWIRTFVVEGAVERFQEGLKERHEKGKCKKIFNLYQKLN